jgi:hypothetical protein
MGTSKKGKKGNKEANKEANKDDAGKVNLRTAAPAIRIRGQVGNATEKLEQVLGRVTGWLDSSSSEELSVVSNQLGEVVESLGALDKSLAALVESGWMPPRKSYTASTKEGDTVSVLDEHRHRYSDILKPEKQVELKIVKKYPGRGGGLVAESKDGTRLMVSTSHVVRL